MANKKQSEAKSPRKSKASSKQKPPVKRKLSKREQRRLEHEREQEARRVERRRARELRQMRRRRRVARGLVFLGFLAMVCLVGLVVTLLLGQPYPWTTIRDSTGVLGVRRRLDDARARWDSLAVRHYEVEVMYQRGEVYCGPARIEVREGQVVDSPDPRESHWFPRETCDDLLDFFTVEGAFDLLQAELNNFSPAQSYLHADFDPDFGHLTLIEAGTYRTEDPDCCWSVTWTDMRPLADR